MSDFRVCVYCGSSRNCDPVYLDDATRLGRELAGNGAPSSTAVGGGVNGRSRRWRARRGGRSHQRHSRFMNALDWGHKGISELRVVRDMHERKRPMIQDANAVVALPGG